MTNQSIQRNIHFTPEQIKVGEKHAKILGLSFNSWVKFLVIKELDAYTKLNNFLEQKIENSTEESNVRFTHNASELNKYIDELDKVDGVNLPF